MRLPVQGTRRRGRQLRRPRLGGPQPRRPHLLRDRRHIVYYPFIVLLLLVLARNRYFDDWTTPLALLLVFLLGWCFAVFSTAQLARTANRARAELLDDLKVRLAESRKANQLERAGRIQDMIAEIQSERRGAFANIFNQPILGATLLPASGLGITWLLDYMARHLI